jgi:hypothetical protein
VKIAVSIVVILLQSLGVIFASLSPALAQVTSRPTPIKVNCAVTQTCPSPPPTQIVLSNLLNNAITLAAPIDISGIPTSYDQYSAQSTPGGWATQVILQNTNSPPSEAEALQTSSPLNWFSDLQFATGNPPAPWATYQYPALPLKFATNASVVFQVPIRLVGQHPPFNPFMFNGPPPPYPSGPPYGPIGGVDGWYGIYWARVEDCLSNSDNHSQANPSVDFFGNPIPCSTADGIPGNPGQWYDIAPIWGATATLGPPPPAGQSISGTLQVPALLPVPTNSLRIEFLVGLSDTPSPDVSFIDDLPWFVGQAGPRGFLQTDCCNFATTRFTVTLPPITVLPAAFVQMKVLPYTILYRPPGDLSSGAFTITQSFSTTMSIGQNNTIDESGSFAQTAGLTRGGSFSAMVGFMGGFSVGGTQGSTTNTVNTGGFDINTIIGQGTTVANSSVASFTLPVGSGMSDPTIPPALPYVVPNTCAKGNYPPTCNLMPPASFKQEPFWEDKIVLLLHPQFAAWNFNGAPTLQMLGGFGQVDSPSITDLHNCANDSDLAALPLSDGDYLSPSDCQQLLTLDPFYSSGQSWDPSISGRGVSAMRSGLFSGVTYGRDPQNPTVPVNPVSLQDVISYSAAVSTNATAAYTATVTDVMGFSWSSGQTLNLQGNVSTGNAGGGSSGNGGGPAAGASASAGTSVTLTNGDQSTNSNSTKITYSASTTSTLTNSTQITGSLNDDHDLDTPACQADTHYCKPLNVKIFIDELFGSFMFQDPNAACNPVSSACRRIVIASAGSAAFEGKGSRNILAPLPSAESAALLNMRTIFQELNSFAQAHPSVGYPSSLSDVDRTLASGRMGGYRVTYIPRASSSGGRIDNYELRFDPLEPQKSKNRYFFMDETGALRTSRAGPANVQSPELATKERD